MTVSAALELAELGLPVVPIVPGTKRPRPPKWQELATNEHDAAAALWHGNAGDGVGVAPAELEPDRWLFVVDIDTHGADGWSSLEELFPAGLPETVRTDTPTGGAHLYYVAPYEVRNGVIGAGLDIRGHGGQVLAPPTRHPDGGEYRWHPDASPVERTIAEAPPELLELVAPPEPAPAPAPAPLPAAPRAADDLRPGDHLARNVDWLELLERDGATVARHLSNGDVEVTRPGKSPRDGISAVLHRDAGENGVLYVFSTAWPGLEAEQSYTPIGYYAATHHNGDHSAAARELHSLYGTPQEPRKSAAELVAATEAYLAAQAPEDGLEAPSPKDPLSDFYLELDSSDFWHGEGGADWLLEPVLARGRAHALYAEAKTGKSFVVLGLVAALATGRPVLGRPAGKPATVLYVDYEMTLADVRDRLVDYGYGPADGELLEKHLRYALLPSLPPLDTPEGGQTLLTAALATGAELVVIDTTGRAVAGEENESTTYLSYYQSTGILLKQAGIAAIRLDHAGKDKTKGARGTSAKNDDVDIVWKLERRDKGHKLTATHTRVGWCPHIVDIAVRETDNETLFELDAEKSWPDGTAQAADLLDDLELPLDASQRTAFPPGKDNEEHPYRLAYAAAGIGKATVWAALEFRRANKVRHRHPDSKDVEEYLESAGAPAGAPLEDRSGAPPRSAPEQTPKTPETSRSTPPEHLGAPNAGVTGAPLHPEGWSGATPEPEQTETTNPIDAL